MQAFKYKGYDGHGKQVQGEVLAANVEEAERRVASQDVTVIAIIPAGMRRGAVGPDGEPYVARRRAISDSEAAEILYNLSVMAETGVPFVEALDAVASAAKNERTAKALQSLKAEIVAGRSLSHAMRAVGSLFPPLVADMVRVAEEGGRLDQTLRSAAGYLERSAELRKRVLNAMMYPMVVMSISMLTILVLVVVVMPKFATIFDRLGTEIPLPTRIMLATGQAVRTQPLLVFGGVVALVIAIRFLLRQPKVNSSLNGLLLRLPLLGDLLRKLAFSRSFYSMGTLLSGNVPLISALEHGAKVSGVKQVRDGLMDARVAVEHGRTLTEALVETKVFPANLIQIVAVGERSGRIAPLMCTVAQGMEREVDARLKALITVVEPVMIILMGLIVGTITLSIIGPIYSVVQNIR